MDQNNLLHINSYRGKGLRVPRPYHCTTPGGMIYTLSSGIGDIQLEYREKGAQQGSTEGTKPDQRPAKYFHPII